MVNPPKCKTHFARRKSPEFEPQSPHEVEKRRESSWLTEAKKYLFHRGKCEETSKSYSSWFRRAKVSKVNSQMLYSCLKTLTKVTGPGPFPKPFFIQNWSKIIISHSLLYLRHGKSTLTRMGQVCEERLAQSSDALWNTPMLAKFPQVDTITCTLDPLRLLFSAPVFLTLV